MLKYPFFYNLYQRIIGCKSFLKNYANEFVRAKSGQNILDIGSGTGNIIPFLPKDINYTGIEISDKYINYASRKYPYCKFIKVYLNEDIHFKNKFDIAFSEGLLASLSDDMVLDMITLVKNNLKEDGRLIVSDVNYNENATKAEKFMFKHERGKNLRCKEDYIRLFSPHFIIDKITEIHNIYRIPYSKIVVECSPKM